LTEQVTSEEDKSTHDRGNAEERDELCPLLSTDERESGDSDDC
jgi:hypothetical protein